MLKLPTVSIVIPAYNEEEHLGACLDAIARQTVKPLEVIVVDNNSTDATATICRSRSFVKVISEPRQGKVFARNRGFDAARGEIIGRIDADTILPASWTETAAAFFVANPDAAAVTGRGSFYDAPMRRLLSVLHAVLYYRVQRLVTGIPALWGANMALRAGVWRQVKKDCLLHRDALMDEDIDLAIHLHIRGFKAVYAQHLLAEASLRRGDLRPKATVSYVSTWHKNYAANGLYGRAAAVYALKILLLAVALPASLVYYFWRKGAAGSRRVSAEAEV